jgi:hypothetical protein
MKKFEMIPLTKEYAEKIRTAMVDDHGHPLKAITLKSRALCRYCLSDGLPGMQHILFSYRPMADDKNPYTETGPVFIHDHCEQYKDIHVFPPAIKTRKHLTIRSYDSNQWLLSGIMSSGEEAESAIEKLFENPGTAYVHVGDASTGCFFLEVVRAVDLEHG